MSAWVGSWANIASLGQTAKTIAFALSPNAKRYGRRWQTCCPAHADSRPGSFTVEENAAGKVLFNCRVGCSQDAVLAALRARGLWPDKTKMNGGKPKAAPRQKANGAGQASDTWDPILPPPTGAPKPSARDLKCDMLHEYFDTNDALLFYVRRLEATIVRGKLFLPLVYGKWNGKLGWHQHAPHVPRPLYGLNRLSHADPDAQVLLCEGEKAADAAMRMFPDYIAMSWMGGAKAADKADYSPLDGRDVLIWPDADDPGLDAAATITGLLPQAKILDTSDLSEGYDAADLEQEQDITLDRDAWLDARIPQSAPQASTTPNSARILTGSNFLNDHHPPVWLIDGLVQRSRLYACTSLTGHGKTAVWLFNACMIQAGRMIGQLDVAQGNVLFLAGENPTDLEARMLGMVQAYNLPPLTALPYVLPGAFPLDDEGIDALKRDIAALGIPFSLIVGDTAASFFPDDDENNNVQMGGYARRLRELNECAGNPAVVMLSHPVKSANRNNLLPRGGGAFLNELDGNLTLWSDDLGAVTELHWQGKIRGPDFARVGYELRTVPTGLIDEKGREEMTIVAEPMSDDAVAEHVRKTQDRDDTVLRSLRDHPDLSIAEIAHTAGWRDEDGRPMRAKVQRALSSLAEDKLIVQTRKGGKWELTEKGEKAAGSLP